MRTDSLVNSQSSMNSHSCERLLLAISDKLDHVEDSLYYYALEVVSALVAEHGREERKH